MGEDTDGLVESTSKLRGLVKGMTGFDIMEDEKTFKSIYDIVVGIGEKWQDLNDIDRAALLEALAGKRGGNALAATLNNIKDLKASYETALGASGSAMKEQENYERSIQYSIDRLKATAQDLAQDFMSSDFIKSAIDALNSLLEILDKIVEKTGSLIPLVTALGAAFASIKLGKNVGNFLDITGLGLDIGKPDALKNIKDALKGGGLKNLLKTPVNELFGGAAESMAEASAAAADTAVEVNEALDVMAGAQGAATFTEAMGDAAVATESAGAAAGAASISLGSLLGILAIAAVVIGAGVIAFNHFNVTVKEVEEEVEEAQSKVSKLNDEIKELESLEEKTTAQQNRLALLKKELAVQNQILESKKALLKLEQTGTKATDRFDSDNYNTKAAIETGHLIEDKSKWSDFWGYFFMGFKDAYNETAEDVLGDINSKTFDYHEFKEQFEAIDAEINSNAFEHNYDKSRQDQLLKSRERALENLQKAEEALSESAIIAESKASELEATLLEMEEKGIDTNSQAYKTIENMVNQLRNSAKIGEKDTGTYDVFSDAEYLKALSKYDEDALRDLINSEKKHDEIVKLLKRDYPDLIKILEQNGYGIGNLIHKYQELTAAEKEAKEAAAMDPLSINESIDSLSSLSDQMGTIDTAFAELFNPDDMEVDLKNIKAIKDTFAEIEGFDLSSIEDELNALYEASSPKEAQEAVDSLANSLIKESKILEGLDNTNKDLITSELKRMGIENAEEVVNSTLAISEKELALDKEFSARKSKELSDATAEEIAEFIEETNRAGEAATEVYLFALKKQFAAGININNPNEIQYLIDLARNAGVAADACDKLAVAKARMQAVEAQYTAHKKAEESANRKLSSRKGNTITVEYATPDVIEYEKAAADAEKYAKEIEDAISKTSVAPKQAIFGGGKAVEDAKKAAKDAGSAAKDAAEQFDWLETKIQRCEEEIQRLDKTVSATYKTWSKRNGAIGSEIDKLREKIALQAKAYEVYMAKANSIPLADSYKQLVMNGGFNIEEISDENLKKLINDFKTWYEKAIQAKDAIEDLNAQIAQLARQKFDNVKSEFEGFTSEIEHFVNMIDNELSHVENMGKIAGKSFYQAKIDQNDEKLAQLQKEREALANALAEAEANGVEKGSADWIAMRNEIYAVDEAIQKLGFDTEELKKKMREVAKLNFDDLAKQFEQAISIITNQTSITDSVVSLIETSGHMASEGYYKALIKGSKKNVKALKKEYETLTDTLDEAVKSGDIEKYSDEWYEMKDKIDQVKKGIIDATEETIKYAEALRQLKWDAFDRGIEGIERLISETDFYIKLLSYKDLFDKKTGDWTEEGVATRGLLVEKYASYKNEANKLGKEAAKIKKELDNDPTNTKLMDRYNDLVEKQRQAILNAQEEKKAIQDLYKQAYDNLLDRIQELINKYKEAIKTAKDLHDYENTINEKTKAVNDIQKQILAYSGDDSEETRATLQKLNSDLINAQKDLQETEYDRYIQDQENLMDQFYNDLQTWVNERLDNLDALLSEAIRATNASADTVSEVINREAGTNRINLSEEMNKIWSSYSAEDSPASKTFNIMTETKGVTDDILKQATDLIKKTELEDYLDELFGDDSDFIENLIDVDTNTKDMNEAIKTTNDALDSIESKIEEYSGDIGEKIDGVKDAVKDLDLSVTVNVDASTGQTDVDTDGGGDDNPKTPEKPKDPNDGKKFGYKIDGVGMLYDSPNTAEERLERDAEKYAREKSNKVPTSEKSAAYSRFLKDYKSQHKVVSGYFKHGGIVGSNTSILDILAELLGEDHMIAAKEGERVLTEDQNKSFEKMVNANFTPLNDDLKDKYSLDKMIEGMTHISTPNVGNMSNVGNTTTVGDINITLPNVTSKEEFVQWLRTDGQIEKIVQSMTTGRMLGGNSFAKMKY